MVIAARATCSTTDDPQPTVSGTADPGVCVTDRVDGTVVGTAGDTGTWPFTPTASRPRSTP